MLKARMITAFTLLPIVFIAIFATNAFIFSCVIYFLVGIMVYEWSNLINLTQYWIKITFLVLAYYLLFIINNVPVQLVLILSLIFWLLAFIEVIRYRGAPLFWSKSILFNSILGLVLILAFAKGLIALRNLPNGLLLILTLLLIVWSADTGAYFLGRKWGKHKLAKFVSPKKTIEGCFGGLVLTILVVGSLYGFVYMFFPEYLPNLYNNRINLIFVVLVTVIFSVGGDLFESLIKRIQGVKDSGTCLPGHGGFLDRTDSLLAAVPLFALASILLKG